MTAARHTRTQHQPADLKKRPKTKALELVRVLSKNMKTGYSSALEIHVPPEMEALLARLDAAKLEAGA